MGAEFTENVSFDVGQIVASQLGRSIAAGAQAGYGHPEDREIADLRRGAAAAAPRWRRKRLIWRRFR